MSEMTEDLSEEKRVWYPKGYKAYGVSDECG